MYEQIDGILACPDLGSAGCAKSRSPCVPLHGVQNRPMYLNLALVYLNLGPPDRSLVPRDVQEASRADFWSDFGPLREALTVPKHCKIQRFCYISRSATDIVQIVQISPLEGPKRPPRGAQERPGTPQERPRRPQDGSKSAKSVPRAPPEPPKDGFRAALAQVGPTCTKKPSRGLPQAILDRFCTLRGRFSYSSFFFGKHSQSCPVGKAVQAYAQHRFTSLCNFYMCISTATDSRSFNK